MAKWTNAAITNKGNILKNRILSGETIEITGVRAGEGTVQLINLKEQTELASEKQALSIKGITSDENNTRISVLLLSSDLEESYNLQQVGFYANDPEDGEILFAIAQADEATVVPSKYDTPMYSIEFNFFFAIENDKSMTCTVEPDVFATTKMLQKEKTERENAISALSKEVEGKVEKEDGKGLSTNDYTTVEKEKLSGIEEGAQKNVEPTKTTTDTTLAGSKGASLEVNAIRGKSEQQSYSGKNLYNELNDNRAYTTNGITLTKNADGTLTISGTATASTNMIMNGFTLPAGTYCLSKSSTSGVVVALYDQTNKAFIAYNSGTFTLSEETTLDIRVQVTSGTTANGTIKIQIEKGSTATEYEPYVGGIASPNPQYEQKIRSVGDSGSLMVTGHGKNCLRNDVVSTTKTGVTFTVNNDKSITVKGTATADIYFQDYSATTMRFKPVIGKKYKLYGYKGQSNAVQGYFVKVNGSSSWVCNPLGTVAAITSSDDILYNIYVAKGTTVDATIYPLAIECDADGNPIGGEEYEPYTESTFTIPLDEPLRSVDDVEDIIVKIKGINAWGVLRNICSFVPTNTDNMKLSSTGNFAYFATADMPMSVSSTNKKTYSSHFTMVDTLAKLSNATVDYGIFMQSAINVRIKEFTTLAEYQQYFTDTEVEFTYVREEPLFEPFADEYQSLFYQLESYDTVTYITTDSEVQPTIEVEYAITDAGVRMLNNYAKSNVLEHYINNQYVKKNINILTKLKDWTVNVTGVIHYGISYLNGLFFTTTEVGSILCSTDANTWKEINTNLDIPITIVEYATGMYIAIGIESGAVYYSTDGVTWSAGSGISGTINSVTYGDGKFVAVGESGAVYYSTDGVTWSAGNGTENSRTLSKVIYAKGRFVAVGKNTFYSTDGITWNVGSWTSYGDSDILSNITYGNGWFVAVGFTMIKYSTDGITWEDAENIDSNMLDVYTGIAYSDGRFVAAGASSVSYTEFKKETRSLEEVINELYSLLS